MLLKEILAIKGSKVWTTKTSATLKEALALLIENKIGALLVLGPSSVVGILSERDIMRECHHNPEKWFTKPVSELMTKLVKRMAPEDSLEDAMGVMTENKIRHLPVVKNKEIVGIVSIGDVVKALLQIHKSENQHMREYLSSA